MLRTGRELRQQRRWRLPSASGLAGGGQVFQDVATLQAAGGDDGQQTFHVARAQRPACAKALFPPQDRLAQDTFGGVVGRLNAFHEHKCPEGVFLFEDIGAGAGRTRMRAVSPFAQTTADLLANCDHIKAEHVARQGSIADTVPQTKHLVGLLQQPLTEASGSAAAVAEGLPVAAQVRPAQLSPFHPVVRTVAIGAKHAGEIRSQEILGTGAIAAIVDGKHGQVGGDGHPQPVLVGLLRPRSLVGVGHVGLLHVPLGFGDRLGDGGADTLLDVADGAEGNRDVESRAKEFFDLAFADRRRCTGR